MSDTTQAIAELRERLIRGSNDNQHDGQQEMEKQLFFGACRQHLPAILDKAEKDAAIVARVRAAVNDGCDRVIVDRVFAALDDTKD